MIPLRSALIVAVAVMGLAGCGAKVYPHPALAPEGREAATVVSLRQKHFVYSDVALGFRVGGEPLVRLRSGQYATLALTPMGWHQFKRLLDRFPVPHPRELLPPWPDSANP